MSKKIFGRRASVKTKQFRKPEYLDKNHPLNKFLRSIT